MSGYLKTSDTTFKAYNTNMAGVVDMKPNTVLNFKSIVANGVETNMALLNPVDSTQPLSSDAAKKLDLDNVFVHKNDFASKDNYGIVRVGDGLNVDYDGTISLDGGGGSGSPNLYVTFKPADVQGND